MKIILLGATGQLGQEWQHYLRQQNQDIKLVSYNSGELDITNTEKMDNEVRRQQPDVVINCAAYTRVDLAEEEQEKAMEVNADAVEQLAQICHEAGSKLVHFSTDYIFPGIAEDKEKFPHGYVEDHTADPVNWYGKTKWEGEQAIRRICDNHLIIRISWLCGRFGSNFITAILKAGKERDKLSVVNDQWGSPSFAENVVENSFTLLKTNKKGTFHVTSEGLITWYDFAQAIFKRMDMSVELNAVSSEEYPTDAKRPSFSKLDTHKIKMIPGTLLQDWRTGLHRVLGQLKAS